ncbi:hypothetical protein H4R99_001283 [Coemansia sp. RSA 1722]|nr:hypothetical protein LPJ57_000542 [Coemansia sp. RSA 486]KAJ2236963.1 hypothetical protein IWW45_001362 [Coemansia sp. RSA 485]KAJ2605235.1 hypothetical protein H4R99_001283 [Coemansia sp. RSA 1722]
MSSNNLFKEMDQEEFEHALAAKLKDPVPTVLRHGLHDRPAQPEYSKKLLQLAAERCMMQLPSTATYSSIGAPAISARLSDPPQRKESIMCQDKLTLNLCNEAEQQHQQNNHPHQQPRISYDRKNNESLSQADALPKRALHLYSLYGSTDNQRRYVLHELLATEETYVKDLEILVAVFAAPLCEYARSQDLQLEVILHPLRALFSFQHSFLRAMYRAEDTAAMARLFLAETTGFTIYVAYCSRYQWLCSMLDQIEADTAWAGFLKEVQTQIALHSDCRRLGLRDFLIKPVQRICKYPLFIKDLIKNTDPSLETTTYADLNHALHFIRSICQRIDQQQQQRNSMLLRQAVITRYRDNPQLPLDLVAKLGSVVLSGPLNIASHNHKNPYLMQTRGCVLFRRFLIIFKVRRSAKITPQYWFPLHTMRLVDRGDAVLWQLEHIRSGQLMSLGARTTRERLLWTEQLSEAIQSSMIRVRKRNQNLGDLSKTNNLVPHMSLDEPPAAATNQLLYRHAAGQAHIGVGDLVHNFGGGKAASVDTASVPASALSSPLLAPGRQLLASAAAGSLAASSTFTVDPKSVPACKYFEPLTSPEILRLQTLIELDKSGSFKTDSSKAPFPQSLLSTDQTQTQVRPQQRPHAQSVPSPFPNKLVRRAAMSSPPINPATVDTTSYTTLSRTGCQSMIASDSDEMVSATSSAELTCAVSASRADSGSLRNLPYPRHSRQQSLWSDNSVWSSKEEAGTAKQSNPFSGSGAKPVSAMDTVATTAGNSPSLGNRLLSLFDNLPRLRRKHARSAKVSPAIEPSKIDSCCSRSSLDCSGANSHKRPESPRGLYPWASVQEASVRSNRVPSSNCDNSSQLILVPFFLASTHSVSKD